MLSHIRNMVRSTASIVTGATQNDRIYDPYDPIPTDATEVHRVFSRKFGKTSFDQLSTLQQSQLMTMDSFQERR